MSAGLDELLNRVMAAIAFGVQVPDEPMPVAGLDKLAIRLVWPNEGIANQSKTEPATAVILRVLIVQPLIQRVR